MKKCKFITNLIILCCLFSLIAPCASALEAPQVNADAVVLADMNSGVILYEKNMSRGRAPASLTKIMSGLLAVEAIESGAVSEESIITALDNCQQGMDEESSNADPAIQPGEQMKFIDILYCALLHSANEACNIIAVETAGGIENFVDAMNLRAREIGCENTRFFDTNGLSADNTTTAYDLYLITKEAIRHPLFATIVNTESYTVPATNLCAEERVLKNSNALLTSGSQYGPNYRYDGVSGVKTGYTNAAGYCLVSTCQRNGMNILCIVLGCNGWLNAKQEDYENFSGSIKLYDWVFENFAYRTAVSNGSVITSADIEGASPSESRLALISAENLRLLLPSDLSDDSLEKTVELYPEKLTAPVAAGDVLGVMTVSCNGIVYGTVPLVAEHSVSSDKSVRLKNAILEVFSHKFVLVIFLSVILLFLLYLFLSSRFRKKRKQHLRARAKAAEKREQEQQKRRNSMRQMAQQQADWRSSITVSESAAEAAASIPEEQKPIETDLDALIRSLGLGEDHD